MEIKSQCDMHQTTARYLAHIDQVRQAQKMMRRADRALKNGRDDVLRTLGFQDGHIEELKMAATTSGGSAFPRYTWRHNATMIKRLRRELAILRHQPCSCVAGNAAGQNANVIPFVPKQP
ncbi:hypothetical protein AAKU55_005778 [Oxalobacteraceae bacterium GrIS 1.11]